MDNLLTLEYIPLHAILATWALHSTYLYTIHMEQLGGEGTEL